MHDLNLLGAISYDLLPVAHQIPQGHDLLVRSETLAQESGGVQLLQPLGITHIGLATRNPFDVPGVDQIHLQARCFERVIFAQELGMDKSDPAIFAKVTELLGVTPQECIFFDDSVKSCRSAKASGMTVIGVYDPFFEGTKDEMPLVCDRFIRDFGEML